ncbi:MAG: NADH-quinone oxidoreductase subunit NuoH [Mycobacterium leprae]
MGLTILWLIVKAAILGLAVTTSAAVFLIFFRKGLGWFAYRPGPNRVGPWGLMQPIADVVKMLFKEDIIPDDADPIVFRLAPIIAFFVALAVWVVIPWGPVDHLTQTMADPNAGILAFLALSALSVYGVALGGWASQSKYSLLGSMRSTAQMISYELSMGMAIVGVILMAGSTRMSDIIAAQHIWNIVPQFLGFVVFFIASLAEAAWTPFDLPEAEAELVGGYNTEYAGMRFGLFFLTELVHAITACAMITVLYLGGWHAPFGLTMIPGVVWFITKVAILLFVLIWIKATWPRFRYDRLMSFGWKVMLPVSALNLVGTAIYVALYAPKA